MFELTLGMVIGIGAMVVALIKKLPLPAKVRIPLFLTGLAILASGLIDVPLLILLIPVMISVVIPW